jgi:HEAT repeat protein
MRRSLLGLFVGIIVLVGQAVRSEQGSVPNNPKDLKDALRAIKSGDAVERTAGLSFLALLGPDAKIASRDVVGLLYDGSKDVRDWAVRALPKVNPEVSGPVLTLVNSRDEAARQEAMEKLSKMGATAAPAIPALLKTLQQTQGADKAAVVAALGAVGTKDPTLSTMLANLALKDPDPAVRAAAIKALPKMEDKQGAVGVVTAMLKDTDPAVRATAVTGLGAFAKGNEAAMQALQNSLQDPSPTVRAAAKAALDKIKTMK